MSQKSPATSNCARSLSKPPYPIKEAGVDWLTVTCAPGETQYRFDELGYSLLHTERELGAKLVPWNIERFEGLNAGMVAVGKREETTMIRMSSSVAWAYWREAFQLATNCSRLDLQLTIENVPAPDKLILRAHKQAARKSRERKQPFEVTIRNSNRSGPTLYLGVRTSARFGRLYNKHRESKSERYAGCVRAELQVNGKAANFAGAYLLQQGNDPHHCIPIVSSFFRSRGVSRLWDDIANHMFHVPRRRGNAASRLRWLKTQVGPAVQTLVDDGYLRATLEALGLLDRFFIELDQGGPTLKEME